MRFVVADIKYTHVHSTRSCAQTNYIALIGNMQMMAWDDDDEKAESYARVQSFRGALSKVAVVGNYCFARADDIWFAYIMEDIFSLKMESISSFQDRITILNRFEIRIKWTENK